MASTAVLLFVSSCVTAVIHALIPDHWLPFALMARSQRWSDRRTAGMVGVTGLLHVAVSLLVGLPVMAFASTSARGLAQKAGHSLEFVAGTLLVAFGLLYGLWAHRREARAHAAAERQKSGGRVHVHGHLLERWFRGAVSGVGLVAIVGISPCVLLQPILFAASAQGRAVIAAAALGFAACTIGTMVGVTLFATRGMRRLDLPFFTRYGDLVSGVLIAGIGVLVMVQET